MPNYHLDLLHTAFERRKAKNARYSLRAFASHLGVHPSALSRILQGKQSLSRKNGMLIVKKLELSKDEQRLFLKSIARATFDRECAEISERFGSKLERGPKPLSEEAYAAVARLLSLAVRELCFTKGYDCDPAWIAERLGASRAEVEKSIEALLKHGLLVKDGVQFKGGQAHLTAVDRESTTRVRRGVQREILERALESLEKDPFEVRGHFGMTMSADPAKLPEANRRIHEFIEELCDFLSSGEPTEVYQLAVQLFPLTKPSSETRK